MAEKFRMRQVRLDRGGYDSSGRYYGVGPVLYEVVDPKTGNGIGMVRAKVGETKQALANRIAPKIVKVNRGREMGIVTDAELKLRNY